MTISQEIKDRVLALHQEKKSFRQIADILKIGKTTVSVVVKSQPTHDPLFSGHPETIVAENIIPTPSIEPMISDTAAADFLNTISPESKSLNPKQKHNPDKKLPESFLNDLLGPELLSPTKEPKAPRASKKAKAFDVESFFSPSTTEVQKAAPKVQEDKGTLISKITMNVQNFEVVLKDLIKADTETFLKSLHTKSVSELDSTLKMFEHTRSSNNMANQLKYGVFATANAIEGLTKKVLKLKSDGYADMIKAQEAEINAILREMAMDESMSVLKQYQTPSVRLATLMATTLLAVDTKNRMSGLHQFTATGTSAGHLKPQDNPDYQSL